MKRREDASECGGCGREDVWVLHNMRHRANYRRLCTNCLLNHHLALFCPFCFHVYDHHHHHEQRVMCLKCPSVSHLSCIPPSYSHSPPSFLCPSCSSPDFFFFRSNLKRLHPSSPLDSIDRDSARALVAAAQIAAISMTKAAAVARVEADKRVKEAALAKKRAREALDRLAYLVSNSNGNNNILDSTPNQLLNGAPSISPPHGTTANAK